MATKNLRKLDFQDVIKTMFYGYTEEFDVEEYDIELRRQRHVYTMNGFFGSFFQSPVEELLEEGCRVLDIGCGIGIWMLTMAKLFPKSTFIGLDLVPLFPSRNLPENVKFMRHDAVSGLPFADSSFDFIHIAYVFSGMVRSEWEKVLVETRRVVKPEGWMDCTEFNMRLYPSNALPVLQLKAMAAFEAGGLDIDTCDTLSDVFECMDGMRLVRRERMVFPMYKRGITWLYDKHADCIDFVAAQMKPMIMSASGWTEETYQEELEIFRDRCYDISLICYKFSLQKEALAGNDANRQQAETTPASEDEDDRDLNWDWDWDWE